MAITLVWPVPAAPAATAPAAGPTPVTVTADATAHQRFAGLGCSLVTDDRAPAAIAKLTPFQRQLPHELLWTEAKLRILRVWFDPTKYAPTAAGLRDPSYFAHAYLDTHRIADARAAGMTTLLLAPDRVPDYFGDGQGHLTVAGVTGYADLLADFLADLAARGVRVQAAGVLNEPNDRPITFTDAQWPAVVKALRAALDRRHLNDVEIVAPESANCGDDAYRVVDAIRADPAAWAALGGVGTHSYSMAATPEMADRAAGKDYWITEAGGTFDGDEAPGDDVQAASVAARFLNDVNHGATHWIYFIGYELADPAGNSDRLLVTTEDPPAVRLQQKYHVLRQLSDAFDVGAGFRRCRSSLAGDMTYRYGPKPRVNVAVARDPDGSWAIGVADFTSDQLVGPTAVAPYNDPKRVDPVNLGGRPSESFRVTVRVPELAGPDVTFRVRRGGPGRTDAVDVPVQMHGGAVSVDVGPLEVVTLRSVPPVPVR